MRAPPTVDWPQLIPVLEGKTAVAVVDVVDVVIGGGTTVDGGGGIDCGTDTGGITVEVASVVDTIFVLEGGATTELDLGRKLQKRAVDV